MPRGKSNKQDHLESLRRRLSEGALILTIAASIFMMLALITYHRNDPGWSHAVTTNHVLNAAGRVGAWLSDFFLYLFGYFAYLFPALLSYSAWLYYRQSFNNESEAVIRYTSLTLKMFGFVLILLSGTALLNLHFQMSHENLPYEQSGGVLGEVIGQFTLSVLNEAGATLLLSTLFLIAVTLYSGLSWIWILEKLGALVMGGVSGLRDKLINIAWRDLFQRTKSTKKDFSFFDDDVSENVSVSNARVETKLKISEPPRAIVQEVPKQFASLIKPRAEENDEQTIEEEVKKAIKNAPRYRQSKAAKLPPLDLLETRVIDKSKLLSHEELEQRSKQVEEHLADFGVTARVVGVLPGPVVTRYEIDLAAGTKVSKITSLAKDLARSMSVISVRVVEVIPGKSVIGLELPNEYREMVSLRDILASRQFKASHSALTLALGKDISGHPVVVDLAKMPHLLVAGTTGSGKSVSLNTMLLSLLYKSTPDQLRLILIDPKMLELSVYDGIPHLLTPVVTDMKDAASALRWCVVEMERRYRLMASLGVRNIAGYNAKVQEAIDKGKPILDPLTPKDSPIEPKELQLLPQIVVLGDEFADMMVVVGKKVETLIARLAQKARAAGVHLILATQRPSVDVITGLIKANIPTRMAFQVSQKVDSRTILDQQGAEQLLGNGDMLYLAPGAGVPLRVHGAYVSDDEVHRVVSALKESGEPDYLEDVLNDSVGVDVSGYTEAAFNEGTSDAEQDEFYDLAVEFVVQSRRVSVSSIQRRFKIGYNRAARIVEAMETAGVVSPMESNGQREVLAPETQQ